MLPPTDSKATSSGDPLSTARSTVRAWKLNGPRKLKSTVFDEVTVALVTIRNCRRYDWILARRALHSAAGWLICKVFCKSIGVRVYYVKLKQSRCHPVFRGKTGGVTVDRVQFLYTPVSSRHARSRLSNQS